MAAPAAVPARARVLQAFRSRDFRLLWTGQASSLRGGTAFLGALGWRTFTLTGSPRSLGYVLTLQGVGLLSTVLLGGALADRYERRTLMLVSDAARFGIIGVLVAVETAGHYITVPLSGVALLAGAVTRVFTAALRVLPPPGAEQPRPRSAGTPIVPGRSVGECI